MHILIIEDDKKAATYLGKGLSESGFVTDIVHQGDEGLHLAQISNYDLIILDVMLPQRDGWSIINEIRRNGKHTPVLFLTACDSVRDRVKGFELGADDYLIKPFAFSELLARVRSILKRGPMRQSEIIKVSDLEIDTIRHKATRAGKPLDLTPKEFLLLSLLVRRNGEVLTKTLIAEQIWDMNFSSETNLVDVAITRLRKKVDEEFTKKLIHTIRGVGYVLEEK